MRASSSRWLWLGGLIACALLSSILNSPQAKADSGPTGPLFGLQPFPYDFTLEALNTVHELAATEGTLAIVHRDNGIPWAEALTDSAFPASVENEWADLARRVPSGRATYLALGPLAEDRVSLAPASQGSSMPSSIRDGHLNSSAVKTAYLNYARRAVARFRPRFLNLGIEAGEMAARAPERWPAFVELYDHVRKQLKRENPDLLVGISFGLPSLMNADVAARAKALVESSDYLGLSFYPYMSPFYERFGAAPLPAAPEQWREALAWAGRYSSKPIAICETGYSSRDVHLSAYDLRLNGSSALQEQYVQDLGQIAQRDHYLFVAWSIVVDYEALLRKLPPGDGRYLLWQNIGLFDGELRPRPAWDAWRRLIDREPASRSAQMNTAFSAGTPELVGSSGSAQSPSLSSHDTQMTAPLSLVASRSGSGVVLIWLPPAIGTPQRYAIAGDAASGRDRLPVVLTDGDSTTYTIPGLPDGTYAFRVYAVGVDGLSPASADATVTNAGAATVPGPPERLEVSVSGASLTATWQPSTLGSSASAFQIEIDDVSGSHEVTTVPASVLSITRPLDGSIRALRVRATRGGMVSGTSNEGTLSLVGAKCGRPPDPPVLLPVSAAGETLTFSWLPSTRDMTEHFRLIVSFEGGPQPMATLKTQGPSASLPLTSPVGPLVARVVAVNACGSSEPSNEVTTPRH